MSTEEGKRRRDELLSQLKNKRNGIATQSPPSPKRDTSVLVPSSSPVAPSRPTTSKFFGSNGSGANGHSHPNGSTSNATSSSSYHPKAAIPSSRIGAPSNNANGSGAAGSPLSIVNAIAHRKEEKSRGDMTTFSYEPSSSSTKPSKPSLADLSPSSPQPLSRLKQRYADETPTKPLNLPSSPDPIRLARSPSNLVSAAKEVYNAQEENLISRLSTQFQDVHKGTIREAVKRHRGDPDKAINEIAWRAKTYKEGGKPPSSPIRPTTNASTSRVDSSPIEIRTTPKVGKMKKNENSRIYANREKSGTKRRDPDESESEAEAGGGGEASEQESEMSWSGDEGHRRKKRRGNDDEVDAEGAALKAFNEVDAEMLTGTIACSVDQANKIISLRPFEDVDDVRHKLTKARGVSFKLFEQYTEIMEGYVQIDACLNRCEGIANDVATTLSIWRGASMTTNESVVGTPRSDGLNDVKVDVSKVSELLRKETDMKKKKILASYIQTQPELLSEGTVLKDYQLLGVNWLNLLYSKRIGCILADEMGLGKTIQVIAFLAHLKERKIKGPHMIYVPASTLENWIREFDKFAPEIDVQTYYGSQAERAALRDDLKRKFRSGKLEVVLASYTQVTSNDDLSFFRKKIQFETCVYDEGHRLKSCTTKAYTDLMSIKPKWRLLLTGTPLQNNLQELVSLLMFIHKDTFTDAEPYLRAIFKSQGHASLLSQQRVSRARTMLTPFVLRRRKAHVLSLPPKTETVEHCQMTPVQARLYRETMKRSKKVFEEMDDNALEQAAEEDEADAGGAKTAKKKGGKKADPSAAKQNGHSSHILMDLRKAASHPLLFRRHYTDNKVRQIAKECLNLPQWCESNFDYVVEDLEIMSDAEISHFCAESEYDELRKFALEPEKYLEGGKVVALRKHIERCKAEGKRMLLFSQFVMILDVLQVALDHLDIQYTRLDGGTRTDERQAIVDEFTDDPDITVFLLSTKAGGVGINLTAASVVVIYDQDFNPHNDRQAADRAYRIGQEKEVEVIKLITTDSIDEDMLAIGETKLQLDDAVGGEEITLDGEAGGAAQSEDKTAKEVRKSLLTTLRHKFEKGPGGSKLEDVDEDSIVKDEIKKEVKGTPTKKKARGAASQAV